MKTKGINQTYTPKSNGRKVIFNSGFKEFFTQTHPYIAILLFIIIGLSLNFYAYFNQLISSYTVLILLPLGIFSFTFVEYMIHRYLFHMDISNRIREQIQYGAHGVHHEYPNDQGRLVMPPLLSIPLSTILFFIAYLVIGNLAYSFMGGFFMGYGLYLFVHYIVHAWKMPKNIFKTLWIYHNIHHYQNEEVAFGVTSPLWDRIFGTMPEYKAGKTKK